MSESEPLMKHRKDLLVGVKTKVWGASDFFDSIDPMHPVLCRKQRDPHVPCTWDRDGTKCYGFDYTWLCFLELPRFTQVRLNMPAERPPKRFALSLSTLVKTSFVSLVDAAVWREGASDIERRCLAADG